MLVSSIINKETDFGEFEIINEHEFETLALCGAEIEQKFCTFIDDEKYVKELAENATMIIATHEVGGALAEMGRGVVLTDCPRNFFFKLHNFLAENQTYTGPTWQTHIASSAHISELTYISKQNVSIGENTIIEPFVTIYPNVEIGNNVIIRSGAKIGGEGFEFKKENGGILSVKHLGKVKISDYVEIQNNSCVDKAVYPWDATILEEHVKVDNLVHIAHGVKIGKSTMLVAQSGIGGRTVIGENTWIGFGATLRNGIQVGNNARTNMGAVVTKSVEDGAAVSGNFAIDHKKFIEQIKKNSLEN